MPRNEGCAVHPGDHVGRHSVPILVVGHASVNRVFLKLWLSLDPECAMRINSPHDTIYLIEDRRKVVARSVTGLETEGFLFHLDRFPSHEDRRCR